MTSQLPFEADECKWCGLRYSPEITEEYPSEEFCSEFCWRDWMDNEDSNVREK